MKNTNKHSCIKHVASNLLTGLSVFAFSSALYGADSDADGDFSSKRSSSYLNFGAGQEFVLQGYEAPLGVDRDARTQFTLEVGSQFMAVPFTYSYGQKLNIFGFKPRLQYLFPLDSKNMFEFGPGVGAIINYWYGSQSVLGNDIELNVLEFGAQLSAHLKMNLLPNFNIMLSPAVADFNFYRHTWVETHSPFGNFTDDNDSRGILYSFAATAGLSF